MSHADISQRSSTDWDAHTSKLRKLWTTSDIVRHRQSSESATDKGGTGRGKTMFKYDPKKVQEAAKKCLAIFREMEMSKREMELAAKILHRVTLDTLGEEQPQGIPKIQKYTAVAGTLAIIISLISILFK